MTKSVYRTCASALALSVALPLAGVAQAQEVAPEATAEEEDQGGLNTIVVTASAGNRTQIESSISVTAIDDSIIQNFQPASEAEIFRLLPGIQTPGTSGPGGNANIAVRGLPVATGGSPFVQLQEDGLPMVLFGDIQFGNNDYWTRFDATTATVEAVRGGSSATLASQAPGAVINYISHTGDREGGFVQINRGLDYNDTRVDFRYGGNLAEGLNFHIGGFLQRGNDILDVDYGINEAIQIKGNLTKEFDDGASFLRLFFKVADTQGINYTGAPALADINGRQVTNIRPFPGFDGRSQSNYSINNQEQLILNREGTFERVGLNGISTDQQYFGAHLHWEFGDNITIDNRARYSDVSGQFSSPFLNVATRASVIGSTINGSTVAAIRYAPRGIRGVAGELFDTLAPEMGGVNRVVLSNLWLFRPVVQKQLEGASSTNAMLRTTTALTIVNAGNRDNVVPGRAEATVNFRLLPGDTQEHVMDHVRSKISAPAAQAGDRVRLDDLGRLAACLVAALEPFDLPWRTSPEALIGALNGEAEPRAKLTSELVNACAHALSADGVLARGLEGFTFRESQQQLSTEIAEAIERVVAAVETPAPR